MYIYICKYVIYIYIYSQIEHLPSFWPPKPSDLGTGPVVCLSSIWLRPQEKTKTCPVVIKEFKTSKALLVLNSFMTTGHVSRGKQHLQMEGGARDALTNI